MSIDFDEIDRELAELQAKATVKVKVSITLEDGELLEQETFLAYGGTEIGLASALIELLASKYDRQER